MADGTISLNEPAAGDTDKKLDTTSLTVGGNTVQRERVQVAGAAAAELADVRNAAPAATDYGMVARLLAEAIANALFVKITDGTDTALVSAAGALLVDGSAVTQPISHAGALAAGTNNIGDVDVLSVVPGTGATALGKAEDAAHASGDTGLAILAVRRDAEAVSSDLDGDYSTVNVDGSGRLWTHDGVLDAALAGSELQVDVVASLPAGTNAIGKLAANSGVDIGDVDVTSIAAGTNVIGGTHDVSGLVIENAISVTVKRAIIDAATSGDNTLVAAVAAKKIRVLSAFLVAAGTVVVRFESGAGGTALTGQMNLVANTGFVLPYNPHGWFETADNTLLNLELSAAISVDGALVYIEAE